MKLHAEILVSPDLEFLLFGLVDKGHDAAFLFKNDDSFFKVVEEFFVALAQNFGVHKISLAYLDVFVDQGVFAPDNRLASLEKRVRSARKTSIRWQRDICSMLS